MTPGHRHRQVTLDRHGWVLYLLQTPLVRTADPDRADSSRWTWGPGEPERVAGDGPVRLVQTYTLAPLGILHTLTGLTVYLEDT